MVKAESNEDLKYILGSAMKHQRSHRINSAVGGCFLFLLIVCSIAFNLVTYLRVMQLEQEVSLIKKNFRDVLFVVGNLDDYDDDDNSLNTDDKLDYSEDYYEEIDNDEPKASFEKVLLGSNFLKDKTNTLRKRRSVIAATIDGVPVNSESYAEIKRRNQTLKAQEVLSVKKISSQPSVFGSSWDRYEDTSSTNAQTPTPPPVFSRKSRVMHRDDKSRAFRQVVKKALKSGDPGESGELVFQQPDFIIRDDGYPRRRFRPRGHLETFDERTSTRLGRTRPLPTIHLSGDTSRYIMGQHSNFKGNGHLSHPSKTFVDWRVHDWVRSSGMENHFGIEDGELTIKEPGLYFIYAQIYYLDEHDTNGFRVYRNGNTLLQCAVASHTSGRILKGNTCYTAGAEYLNDGDKISLADTSEGRFSLFEPGKSFFGVIKLGDLRTK